MHEPPPKEGGSGQGPLEGLPPVEAGDLNRNPLEQLPPTGQDGAERKGVFPLGGVVLLVVGLVLIFWSRQREPTVENVLSGRDVISDGAFTAAQAGGWAAVVIGGLFILLALLRAR